MISSTSKYRIWRLMPISVFLVIFLVGIPPVSAKIPGNCKDGKKKCTVQNKPYMTKEFTLQGPGVLKVYTLAGDIEINSVDSNEKVRVELYVDRGYAFWSNTKNLDNYRITMIQRGNEVLASVEQKEKTTGLFSDPMTFSYKIYVPTSISTELKTAGGHVTLSGVQGEQLLKSSGGNIRVSNTSGKVGAYTSGGNIDISSSKGIIFAQTEGGNITIDDSKGEFRLKTNGGRILSERVSGSMLARVGGGDIRAHFLEVAEGVSLETTAGSIFLEVPESTGYELLFSGSEVVFPGLESFEGIRRVNHVEGVYKQGGVPINLHTNHGTVTFKMYR